MITVRDLVVALVAVAATICVVDVLSQSRAETPVMQSALFDWNAITSRQTDVGAVRQFFRAPTVTLDELECHVTTLKPGATSHPPHKHPNEELVIVKEGTVEALVNGETKRAGQFRSSMPQQPWDQKRRNGPATLSLITGFAGSEKAD